MDSQTQTVVVVGQGYVGLPLAMRAVEVGYRVIGVDLAKSRVAALRAGTSYVEDITDETLRNALASGRYLPTDDYAEAQDFDVSVITVPTPLRDSLPDLSFIESATASIGAHLTKGATVVLESTTYPGTTQELVVPILESASGLNAGVDFHVGYSPERIDPGNQTWGFVETPKVVSGIDDASLGVVQEFYDRLVNTTIPVTSPKEAELTKLLENTFRHVNIALVNELAVFAHQLGVNVWEAIDAAATKPFGFMKFTPGPGVGGHCLPVDPSYLSWQVRRSLGQSFRFVELANDVNDSMPGYVVQRAMEILNQDHKPIMGSSILLLGLSYKRNSSDIREAPALRISELLQSYGGHVMAADPLVPQQAWPSGIKRVELDGDILKKSDLVLVITDHDCLDLKLVESSGKRVLDTRNKLSGAWIHRL